MANPLQRNGEVIPALSFGFANEVHRDWIKSPNPENIITCKHSADILISCDANLCRRVVSNIASFSWNFKIWTCGKRLQRVMLSMDQNRSNFTLKSVSNSTHEIGVTNGQEWYSEEEASKDSTGNTSYQTQYYVKLFFITNRYGTYRQNILFYFGEYPVIVKRICMDCVPKVDFLRIHGATEYLLLHNPKVWASEMMPVQRFESPFVPPRNPKEEGLSMIYPYPDRCTFLLTQQSLTEECLTPENYRGRLHELIAVEELARHEQIARYNQLSPMRLMTNYVLTSTGDASSTVKFALSGELFAQLPLSRSISEDTKSGRLFLRGCSSVLFKCVNDESDIIRIFEAHIEDKCTQTIYIRLSKDCVQTLNLIANTDVNVQIQFVLSRLPFCEWHKAVDALPSIGLVFLKKIHLQIQETSILNALSSSASMFTQSWDWLVLNPILNAEQRRALAIMTSSIMISLPPILLHGPFGTGKTFTIAQALRILLIQNPNHKILICTHSNSAADLYVKEFFDVWYKTEKSPRLKPIRIYYKDRNITTVHEVVQQYSLMNPNGTFREPTEDDLQNCNLVVTTLATSSCLTCLKLSFTHIVIDEAAQALECEVLIPLALATEDTRLILAGDQKQLSPEIYSDLANECGLGISLLERIAKTYPHDHPCKIHLCQNYRAHADIIRFTSEMFYDGMVKPGNNLLQKHPVLRPLTFHAVQGEEIQGMQSTGYAHAEEATELANRVLDLKNAWPVDRWGPYGEGSIGVVSYYAEQVQRIRMELRKRKLNDVSVERVLNVQGKQFTAVFISTVRTRSCCQVSAERKIKDFGFLTNPRLLNTALTRAKCLVVVFGDPIALLTIGSCRRLWRKYMDMADLYGIDRDTLNYHLNLLPESSSGKPLNPLAQEFVPRNLPPACFIEYVPMPRMYPVVYFSPNCWMLR